MNKAKWFLRTPRKNYWVFELNPDRERYGLPVRSGGTYYLAASNSPGDDCKTPFVIWVSDSTPSILEALDG